MAKKLLEEATIRRFQKIAGISHLTESFQKKLEEEDLEEGKEEEKMEESLDEMYNEKDSPEEEEVEVEVPEEESAPPEEMGPEMSSPDSDIKSRIMPIIKQLADLADLELEVEGEDEGGMEDEGGDEGGMEDEGGDEGGMGDEEVMEEGEHMEETPVDPAGKSLDQMQPMTGSKGAAKNASMSPLKTHTADMAGGKPMQESKINRNKLVEQVAKRVADRLKNLK